MSVHIEPIRVYLAVFLTLMVLTALTVLVAYQHFGALNDLIAMGIAVTKATVVVLFFMHLRHSVRMIKMVLLSAIGCVLIFSAYLVADYLTRGSHGAMPF